MMSRYRHYDTTEPDSVGGIDCLIERVDIHEADILWRLSYIIVQRTLVYSKQAIMVCGQTRIGRDLGWASLA